jgi:hypothetical protein
VDQVRGLGEMLELDRVPAERAGALRRRSLPVVVQAQTLPIIGAV